MSDPKEDNLAVAKLTALWALSEGGLGGILHATRLPMRGVVLACIAAAAICLITHAAGRRTAALRAAIIVIAVKAVLAPHSLGTAHLAVLNQALLGTGCMVLFGPSLVGCLLTGALCLIETSLHPLLWATILGGTDLWVALDDLLVRGQRWLVGRTLIPDPARWGVLLLVGVHAVFGLFAGLIAWRLPRVAGRIVERHRRLTEKTSVRASAPTEAARSRRPRWVRTARAAILIVAVVMLAGPGLALSGEGVWYRRLAVASARVVAVIGLLVFVVRPLATRLTHWLLRRGRANARFPATLVEVRTLQDEAATLWRESACLSLPRRLPHVVAVMFATALIQPE